MIENVIPKSEVRFLSVPLNLSETNQLDFDTADDQTAYFLSKTVKTIENVNYIKDEDGVGCLKIQANYNEMLIANYIMYKNTFFSNRYFYAYITKIEYCNPNVTYIYFKQDVFQSWLFNFSIGQSFVERCHTDDDSIGANTYPEGLETGEYVYKNVNSTAELLQYAFIIGLSDNLDDGKVTGGIYANIYSGLCYKYFTSAARMNLFIDQLAEAGKSDAITIIFTIPKAILPKYEEGAELDETVDANTLTFNYTADFTKLDGYTPKNNKLFSYPYNFICASNNKGNTAEYHFENFQDSNNITFKIQGTITPNSIVALIPSNYKKDGLNYDEKLTLDGYPLCSWSNDVFANYIAQNKNQIKMEFISSAVGGVTGLAANIQNPLGGVSSVANTATNIFSSLAKIKDYKTLPDHAGGNVDSGDFSISNDIQQFTLQQATLKYEYAQKIDDYFTMYGYKMNKIMYVLLRRRLNFDYIKTIGANVKGSTIPNNHLLELINLFDNGITIWHNPNNFLNYKVDNPIRTP